MDFDEPFKGTVISLFDVIRKTTGRQLVHAEMIMETFAAITLARAGSI